MKSHLIFIVLLGFCYANDIKSDSKIGIISDKDGYEGYPYEKGYTLKLGDKYNIYRVGLEKNDKEDIYRPCEFDDWKCIRKFFAANADCKPTHGPIPDPLYLDVNTEYYNFAKLTITLNKLKIIGLSKITVSELYVNRETGNVVLALKFRDYNETIPRASFRYRRTGKESIVLNDFGTVEIRSGTFTAVIPKVPHLRLDKAEIHADIDDAMPAIFVGPNAFNSTDPEVLASVAIFLSNTPTIMREMFLVKSSLLTGIFVQKNICDFGLKLYSL